MEQRAIAQWFLRITKYADELLNAIAELKAGWPERVLLMQSNWIGRSEGAEVDFTLDGSGQPIRVFTTRIDTIFGAACLILAPEHPHGGAAGERRSDGAGQEDDRFARGQGSGRCGQRRSRDG